MPQDCPDEHRLIGIAHICEQFLAVGVIDQRPAILSGVFPQGLLPEIFERPVSAHGHGQVGNRLALPDVPLDGLPALPHRKASAPPSGAPSAPGKRRPAPCPFRELILNFPELRAAAQEDPQLVLRSLWMELHLPHCPAVHLPAHIDHAVLLEQIVIKFTGGHKALVVGALAIDLSLRRLAIS